MKKRLYLGAADTSVELADCFNKIIDALPEEAVKKLEDEIIVLQEVLRRGYKIANHIDNKYRDLQKEVNNLTTRRNELKWELEELQYL